MAHCTNKRTATDRLEYQNDNNLTTSDSILSSSSLLNIIYPVNNLPVMYKYDSMIASNLSCQRIWKNRWTHRIHGCHDQYNNQLYVSIHLHKDLYYA